MLDVTVAWMWPDGFLNHTLIGDGVSEPLPLDVYDRPFETTDGHMVAFVASDDEWRGFARAVGAAGTRDGRALQGPAHARGAFGRVVRRDARGAALGDDGRVGGEARCGTGADRAGEHGAGGLRGSADRAQTAPSGGWSIPRADRPGRPAPAARFDTHALDPGAPAPMLGQHTDEVLAEIGMDDVAALREATVVG